MTPSLGLSPTLVGLMRGLVYAVLVAAGSAAVAFFDNVSAEEHGAVIAGCSLLVGRALEGFIDKLRGQAPQEALGSRPADPGAYVTSGYLSELEEWDEATSEPVPVHEAVIDEVLIGAAVARAMPRSQPATRERVTGEVLAAVLAS